MEKILDKRELLSAAMKLAETLKTIENLLEGYKGIEGNENYVKYCLNKAKQANDYNVKQIYNDTYAYDISKRREASGEYLYEIIRGCFKLLDDIDTAGDMFKPKWCKFTSAVEELHRLRWLYCTTKEDDDMSVNGNCENQKVIIKF